MTALVRTDPEGIGDFWGHRRLSGTGPPLRTALP
jgi:hypothetical protein